MSYYTTKAIYPWLYSIYDPQSVFCYLIVGEKAALLYDTAYGIAPLHPVVREITPLPYQVLLSHGHIDHVNGAYQFDEVLIHPADHELCLRHACKTARSKIVDNLKLPHNPTENTLNEPLPLDMVSPIDGLENFDPDQFITAGPGNLKMLAEGQTFDLGGLTVEVVPMEGHTPGSVGLLIKEHKVLLDSDAANYHMWMFLNESLSMDTYINMLKRVKGLDFDTFFVGHSDQPRPKADFDKYIAVAEGVNVEASTPYPAMAELGGRLYKQDDVEIIFKP